MEPLLAACCYLYLALRIVFLYNEIAELEYPACFTARLDLRSAPQLRREAVFHFPWFFQLGNEEAVISG